MKTLKIRLGIASLAIISSFAGTSDADATDLALKGRGSVSESRYDSYRYDGARQRGRYENLGEGYYRRTKIRVNRIRNYSKWRSGTMSFELWAMPYYGASYGSVLMTTNAGRVSGWSSKRKVRKRGNKLSLDEYAFPELNLWEYTRKGWRFRDNIAFSRDRWM